MANLGSSNTPISGESFELPAGAKLDEDDGELVVRDSSGSIILRRDETEESWDFVSTDLQGISSLETKSLSNDYLFAGSFDGSDADARLDNCLSAASEGSVIYLENAEYNVDRTIDDSFKFVGVGKYGSDIESNWTVTATRTVFDGVSISTDVELSIEANLVQFLNAEVGNGCTISISDDRAVVIGVISAGGGDVIFETGTSNGIIDSSTQVNVTDNGDNTIGDIA